MTTRSLLKASGLQTYSNELSEISPGALTTADNVNIDRPGIIEPRRGYKDYGNSFPDVRDRAKQLLIYKSRILRHYFDNTDSQNYLQFDSDGEGNFLTFDGVYNETETGLRIKGIEANGNFYFTTSDGIKKISALTADDFTTSAGYITSAGGVNALDVTAIVNYAIAGFFEADSSVGYRVVWNIRDRNNNIIAGAPSSRTVVFNTSPTLDAVVDLTFTVPDRVTSTDYFYQVYRTAVFPGSTTDPGDEMNLVFEANITDAEIAAQQVTLTDITPEDFRAGGALLYTNPVSGDGIDQANFEPPIAKDIASFRESVFYANTKTKHRMFLNLLSISGFVSDDSTLIVSSGLTTNEYIFRGENKISQVQTVADVASSLNNKYFYLSSANNDRQYYVWYNVGGAGVDPNISGRIGVMVAITVGATANAVATATKTAIDALADFLSAVLTNTVSITNFSNGYADDTQEGLGTGFTFVNTGGVTQFGRGSTLRGTITNISVAATTTITSINHKLVTGDQIIISGSNSTPTVDGLRTITRTGTNTFTIPVTVTVAGTTGTWIESQNFVLLSSLPTTGQQVDETARSIVHEINVNNDEIVYATYLSGPSDVPGQILLEGRDFSDVSFFLAVSDATMSDNFNPELPVARIESGAGNISATDPTILTTGTPHGLSDGDRIVIYNSNSTPNVDGIWVVDVLSPTTFSIDEEVTVAGSTFTWFETLEGSDNEVSPNRIYFSKYQQPEAVPLVNFIDIGPKDKEIKRILALRDSLFILKEEGVYRLSGLSAPNFSVSLFDSSVQIIAADSADILNNQIFGLFNNGVCTIDDGGVSTISKPIKDLIDEATTNDHVNFPTATWGLANDSSDSYGLWTTTDSDDTVATQSFRYNQYTNTWTRWIRTDVCGILGDDDKIYLGISDRSFIQQERKTFTRRDYADREIELQIPVLAVNDTEVVLTSTQDVDVGDIVSQTQYLTIVEYNRTLRHLDDDLKAGDHNYFAVLEALPGDSLRNKVNELAIKLDNDPGITDTNYLASLVGTNTFPVIQSDFNIIIGKLNIDPAVFFSNYDPSVDVKRYEMKVVEVLLGNTVILRYATPFIEGPVTIFKGIPTTIVYAENHLGDPSIYKQVHGSSMLFERNIFTSGILSYSSDLSPVFDSIPFEFAGAGIWGLFVWDEQTWGGEGSGIPLRTLVPLQKQRCRYISLKFEHSNAFERYAILGISFSDRSYTPEERAYR